VEDSANQPQYPVLQKDDEAVLHEINAILTNRLTGDPYSTDGSFAANLAKLPPGLRAMAATHWLDVSLTLDSITWHFGNFGEPHLVEQTEAGLKELGLDELAQCLREAAELMLPFLARHANSDADFSDLLESDEIKDHVQRLDDRAWELNGTITQSDSAIYNAWVRYARAHPERIFDPA
jgi:hypothetical protein